MVTATLAQGLNRSLYLGLVITLLVGLAWGLLPAQAVHADTYTVCTTGCDFTTVQAAIDDAGVAAGDVINITAAVHTEAAITVNKDVTIRGQGADSTIVQAHATARSASDRVFLVASGATVTVKDMTIRHGNPTSEPESGGGIRNEGTLTLEHSVVSDNSASAGGGILNDGTLTLVNCTVSGNEARGGSVHYIECSTGGGIKDMQGTLTLINSTVSGNNADGKGGGIHVACKGTLVLINSTISGNRTNRNGGGVYLDGVGEFTTSTISDNSAKNGGGVYLDGSAEKGVVYGLLNFRDTIIAHNVARLEKYGVADCVVGDYASIGTNINNLVGDNSCSPAYSGDPMLDVLAGHDGRVQTHALLPGSPAIDTIPADECAVDTDQRGVVRPQGAGCDIGAFELQDDGDDSTIGRLVPYGLLLGVLALGGGGLALVWRRRRA